MSNTISDVSVLRGLWRRSLIVWPNGERDTTTEVRWLQGLRACIDLRQAAAGPDLSHVRSVADLSIAHCAWLARQQGFAGHLAFDGSCFQWIRSIDYQPQAPGADAGSLHWDGAVLVETGRDVAYVEHWHRDAALPTVPAAALELRAADDNTAAALLRVGALFMFARDRALRPAAHRTLAECVAGAASLRQAQALVDCEISFGNVQAAQFRITASTLPHRVGDQLHPLRWRERLTTSDRAATGSARTRHWSIVGAEGDLAALAPVARSSAHGS